MNSGTPPQQLNVSDDDARRHLERILNSRSFVAAPQLRNFLEYVATELIDGRSVDIKEYTIGTKVFGREGFDPRMDTLVRTQASRLRTKLERYYRNEGASDKVCIEIPIGRYVPKFFYRAAPPLSDTQPIRLPDGEPEEERANEWKLQPPRKARSYRLAAIGCAIIACLALAVFSFRWAKTSKPLLKSAAYGENGLVAQLWGQFADRVNYPILCFTDHATLINRLHDELYYLGRDVIPKGTQIDVYRKDLEVSDPRLLKSLGPLYFNDGVTGYGEVMGVADLTRVFTQLGSPLILRRGWLLSSADLKEHNVIFLGGPAANSLSAEVAVHGEFEFAPDKASSELWSIRILNRHPLQGESAFYAVERDSVTKAIRADYAVAGVVPGNVPEKRVAIMAGITTEGTLAAAEFLTSEGGLAEIASRLGTSGKNAKQKLPPYFQIVLRAEVARGDVLQVRYVTGRIIHAAN